MADIGELRYLYTGRIEERDGSYVIEVPAREVDEGELEPGEESQIGVFGPVSGSGGEAAQQTADETTETTDDEDRGGEDRGGEETGTAQATGASSEPETPDESEGATEASDATGGIGGAESLDEVEVRDPSEPPVDEGETRTVEIVDEGEQGDGLARIDRGYIVFVPGTEPGDTVEIRITDTKENFAFGEIVE